MRSSFDFPDDLMTHLKILSAQRNISLKALLIDLIEKGLISESAALDARALKAPTIKPPPSVRGNAPMTIAPQKLTNADLFELIESR